MIRSRCKLFDILRPRAENTPRTIGFAPGIPMYVSQVPHSMRRINDMGCQTKLLDAADLYTDSRVPDRGTGARSDIV